MDMSSLLGQQLASDLQILEQLEAHGDDPSLPHTLEHHFLAHESGLLEALGTYARAVGFETGAVLAGAEADGKAYWYFDVVSRHDALGPQVSREAALMTLLAVCYRVMYDGWGTCVEQADAAPRGQA